MSRFFAVKINLLLNNFCYIFKAEGFNNFYERKQL